MAEQVLDSADDDDSDLTPIPKGAKNYMTPAGFTRLREELRHLLRVERPRIVEIVSWAAGNGDRSENGDYLYGKKRLREIDRRIRFLNKRLEAAEVVDPALQPQRDRVFFGATVTFVREDDSETTVTIVGIDEIDEGFRAEGEPPRVSWISPIARTLLKSSVGDCLVLRTPAGPQEIEVLAIRYPEGPADSRR
jgi:transcription elongation factor GreB